MRIKSRYITALLVAGAAATAIGAAPTSAAASGFDPVSRSYVGSGLQDNQCQTPGNVQINDAPPPVQSWGGNYGPFFGYDRGRR